MQYNQEVFLSKPISRLPYLMPHKIRIGRKFDSKAAAEKPAYHGPCQRAAMAGSEARRHPWPADKLRDERLPSRKNAYFWFLGNIHENHTARPIDESNRG